MDRSAWRHQFEQALAADDGVRSLRGVVVDLLVMGRDRVAVNESLLELRSVLAAGDREADEDVVLDVLDMIEGWCAPGMRID
jgi:hypothetical protein